MVRKKNFKRLIMFSGGIDSTYLLAKLLRDTEDTILAHHVHLVNWEGRDRAEAEACRKIVDYCRKNFREFIYTESTVDRRGFSAMGYDVITVASEGGIAASDYLFKTGRMPEFWMLGLNTEEAEALDETYSKSSDGDNGNTKYEKPKEGRLPYVLAAMAASCYPNAPPKYLRPVARPKKELMEFMGKELVDLCWTCRRPSEVDGEFKECGMCHTCKLIQSIQNIRDHWVSPNW